MLWQRRSYWIQQLLLVPSQGLINAPPKTCTCPNPPPSPNPSHFISQLDNTVGKSRQHETYINKNRTKQKWSVPMHQGNYPIERCTSPTSTAARESAVPFTEGEFKHSEHAPRCNCKCCRTTGRETEHLNFSPQDSFFRNTHGYPAKGSCSNTQWVQSDALAQVTISSSARYKACGQEETSAERSRISRTALVIDAPVCQTLSPLRIPDSYHRQLNSFSVIAFLRLCIFGRVLKAQLLLFHSDVKSRNIGGSCRRSNWAAGMSAGDQNSALNFKCHCTKSGDTEWGVNWPSQ